VPCLSIAQATRAILPALFRSTLADMADDTLTLGELATHYGRAVATLRKTRALADADRAALLAELKLRMRRARGNPRGNFRRIVASD
jgi:hypothetical protein